MGEVRDLSLEGKTEQFFQRKKKKKNMLGGKWRIKKLRCCVIPSVRAMGGSLLMSEGLFLFFRW